MMTDFVDILNTLLDEGIEVTLRKKDGLVWYDMNVNAKSHLWVSPTINDEIKYHMRYKDGTTSSTLTSVLDLARQSRCGRDFMSHTWLEVLVKHGLLQKRVVETVTYE
jgi:hypothetical protein